MANRGVFSLNSAMDVTRAKQIIFRKAGVPLTKSGRQRKLGGMMACCLPMFLLLLLSLCTVALAIEIVIDGVPLEVNAPAQIVDGRTMVPLRSIFEGLGAEVDWIAADSKVIGSKDGIVIEMQVGNLTAYRNSVAFELAVPPLIIQDRTFVPVRAIAESFDCEVGYDAATQLVSIFSVPGSPGSPSWLASLPTVPSIIATSNDPVTIVSAPSEPPAATGLLPYPEGKTAETLEVYVSRTPIIHTENDCSGMVNFQTMSLAEARLVRNARACRICGTMLDRIE